MCNKMLLVGLSNTKAVKAKLDKYYPNDVYVLNNGDLVIATELHSDAKVVDKQLDWQHNPALGTGLVSELTYITGYYDDEFFKWAAQKDKSFGLTA